MSKIITDILFGLEVKNKIEPFEVYFSTENKAIDFIKNNYEWDNPRKVTNEFFKGENNQYIIKSYESDKLKQQINNN